jgi:hypothetical protein
VQRVRRHVEEALRADPARGVAGGLLDRYTHVTRLDGSHGRWHPGLCPRGVLDESIALRAACYCFIAALSMMRDSDQYSGCGPAAAQIRNRASLLP